MTCLESSPLTVIIIDGLLYKISNPKKKYGLSSLKWPICYLAYHDALAPSFHPSSFIPFSFLLTSINTQSSIRRPTSKNVFFEDNTSHIHTHNAHTPNNLIMTQTQLLLLSLPPFEDAYSLLLFTPVCSLLQLL